MNTRANHLAKEGKSACGKFAVIISLVAEPERVTCRRCLRKIHGHGLNYWDACNAIPDVIKREEERSEEARTRYQRTCRQNPRQAVTGTGVAPSVLHCHQPRDTSRQNSFSYQ